MAKGTLELLLVHAKGLDNTDFLTNVDTYAVITCQTQEKRSNVASGQGTNPEWHETFLFAISHGVSEIRVRLMDKDTLTRDDFLGETTIILEELFKVGSIPPTSYKVVKDENYCGEVKIGLDFFPQADRESGRDEG